MIIGNKKIKGCDWFKNIINTECDAVRAIFDTIDAMVIVFDKEGKIIYLNKKCEEKISQKFSEITAKHIWDIFGIPEEAEYFKNLFHSLKNINFPNKHENYWTLKNNEKIFVSWTDIALLNEKKDVEFVILTGFDITDDRKLEKQLEENQEKYINLIENTPLCIKVFNEEGKLIFLNKGGREEHSIKDTDDIGKWDWIATVKPQYRDEAREKFKKAFKNGESSRIEFEHTPEGSNHEWCSSLISPIKDSSGKVKSVLFLSDDITDLKKAQLEAKKNEQIFKTLIDETPLCVKWFDHTGNLIFINKEGRKEHFLESRSENDLKKWDYMASIDEAYKPMVKDKMLAALNGETNSFEMKHAHGMSRGQWCYSTLAPVKDSKGDVVYIMFLSRDITDEKIIDEERRKNLEKAEETKAALFNILEDVKESEKATKTERDRSNAIISSMGESLLVIDKNFNIVLMNVSAEKALGIEASKTIGTDIRKLIAITKGSKSISDEDRPLTKVIENKKSFSAGLEDDYYYKSISGKKFPVMFSSTPLIGDKGIMGAVLIFKDITDEKSLDESKSSFISIASHQLRTPLTSMRWFSEMLIAGDAGPLNEEQKHFAERIYQATDRMIDLVNLLLQIARIEAGRVKVEPIALDLKKSTEEIINSLKADVIKKSQKITIKTNIDPFPEILLDKEIIWQVIQNLISNAMRYSPEGKEILILIEKDKNFVKYSIKDQGIGIPADQKDKIFQKFFRAENALKFVPEGSGLGLSLVKSLVESWGGKIWFESEENKGTIFYFTIPISGMKYKEGDVKLAI